MPRTRSEQATARLVFRRRLRWWEVLSFFLILGTAGPASGAQLPNPDRSKVVSKPAPRRIDLTETKPTFRDKVRIFCPEWLVMTAEILGGNQLQPSQGWFARGKSSTRMTWASVAARLDQDHNRSITRSEFPGSDQDFHRLDRDQSQALTRDDFAFSHNALQRSRSKMIMSFADQDRDGKVKGDEYRRMIYLATRDHLTQSVNFADAVPEVRAYYEASVKEGLPYLTAADLRETVDLAAKSRSMMVIPDVDADIEVASRTTLLKALINRDIGVLRAGPALEERAPDFDLPMVDGRGRVALAKLLGKRPVVLILGNYTSPGFRMEAGTLEKLYQRYKNRAEFLLVYVREEHPSDGWVAAENSRFGISVAQPTTDAQRVAVALQCRKKLGLALPMVVDSVDDRVGILYSGMPDRLYLLDPEGTVAYKSGRGPFGFHPDELEQALVLLLQTLAPATSPPASAGVRPTPRPKPLSGAP